MPRFPLPVRSTLQGEDWEGRHVSGERAANVAYFNVDMSEIESEGSVFEECTFRGVRFNVSTHRDTAFVNCVFGGCNFFDASFSDCKLVGSAFERCTFGQLRVQGGDWSFADLSSADLHTASFDDVRMREADLTRCRLDGATLRGCDLSGATLAHANLTGCDLRGSDLSSLDPATVELRDAVITWQQAVTIAQTIGLDVRSD